MTDEELLRAWSDGDRDAGERLFERHFESVVRFFRNKAAGDHEDLIQQTFLGCVESLGLRCDGRFLALNSYENRVYQVGLEDAEPLVVKFYRPGRWSDAAIAEEHAFARALADHELPVVAPSPYSLSSSASATYGSR